MRKGAGFLVAEEWLERSWELAAHQERSSTKLAAQKATPKCSGVPGCDKKNRSGSNLEYFRNRFKNRRKNRSNSVLGAMLTQDDTSLEPSWPKMNPRIDFWFILDQKSNQKPSNFQTFLETLFSANGVHKSSKMRIQNRSIFFPGKG